MPNNVQFKSGFTLAELLISLAILGVIATFTIPKILVAQQNSANAAKAKEVAAMVAGAYDAYRQDNINTTSTTIGALTPYMNYVAVDNSTSLDDHLNTNTTYTCGTNATCLKMHGGGTFFTLRLVVLVVLITRTAFSFSTIQIVNAQVLLGTRQGSLFVFIFITTAELRPEQMCCQEQQIVWEGLITQVPLIPLGLAGIEWFSKLQKSASVFGTSADAF